MQLFHYTALYNGKGDLAVAYKVKRKKTFPVKLTINGESVDGLKIEMQIEKKVLVNIRTPFADLDQVTLYTAHDVSARGLAIINNQKVIGYKTSINSGSSEEIIMDRYLIESSSP